MKTIVLIKNTITKNELYQVKKMTYHSHSINVTGWWITGWPGRVFGENS
jgi:hypothetical protein